MLLRGYDAAFRPGSPLLRPACGHWVSREHVRGIDRLNRLNRLYRRRLCSTAVTRDYRPIWSALQLLLLPHFSGYFLLTPRLMVVALFHEISAIDDRSLTGVPLYSTRGRQDW